MYGERVNDDAMKMVPSRPWKGSRPHVLHGRDQPSACGTFRSQILVGQEYLCAFTSYKNNLE